MIPVSRKVYRYLLNNGYTPKPTPAEIKTARKHNRELAQRLSEAIGQDKPGKNAPKGQKG